jgi:hypothetical protein
MQSVWFHGTTRHNAYSILRNGFREGTWFARHMEDAVKFGGEYVFSVRIVFEKCPIKWQVCTANAIPKERIAGLCSVKGIKETTMKQWASYQQRPGAEAKK